MPFSKWSLNYWWFLPRKIIQNFPDLILIRSSSCYQFSLSMPGYQDAIFQWLLHCPPCHRASLPTKLLNPLQISVWSTNWLSLGTTSRTCWRTKISKNSRWVEGGREGGREGEGRGWVRVRCDAITLILWGEGSRLHFYYYYLSISSSESLRCSFVGTRQYAVGTLLVIV